MGGDRPSRCPIRSVYFAERMAERLRGIDGVEVEVIHSAIWYNAQQEETWDL